MVFARPRRRFLLSFLPSFTLSVSTQPLQQRLCSEPIGRSALAVEVTGGSRVAGRGSTLVSRQAIDFRIAQNPSGGQGRWTTSNETKRARGRKKKVAGDAGSLTRWHRVKMGTESKIFKRRVS